ncbi:TrmB family transcriptional regulator [Salinirubellus salinus]|uniref:TrmB family transcriptional regulator n=1 Tax=Salinirubellus salinus TaxID=1364945 RepID=A0A9E7U973_9EURY|nr:helix-turn-helix domain-containing protein [Salinirubellus salinus]UWM52772.1 TrmB family transcriptional regulator [Salinirubellus salinus]
MTDDADAIAALERLGLSNYEARAFVALQRLGTGTARDIHDAADIPRSQVYGAADSLEDRGLVNVQQSRPKLYRPVSLEQANQHLTAEFEHDRQRAFDHLEAVQAQSDADEEQAEEVWTITGRAAIDSRVASLIDGATDSVIVAAGDPQYLPDSVVEALQARLDAGIDIVGVSGNPAVLERFEELGIPAMRPDEEMVDPDERLGTRLLLVDGDTLLLGVRPDEEIAVWSAGSTFATVFGSMLRRGLLSGERHP